MCISFFVTCKDVNLFDVLIGSTAEVWDHDADTQHVWRYSRSMQFRVPFLYPQCNTHSTHTAIPVYRHTVCVISAHCAAVVCASSENNGGREFENYNAIRRTVAEVLPDCHMDVVTSV